VRILFFALAFCCVGCTHLGPAFEWNADAGSSAVADDNWLFSENKISSVGVTASFEGTAKRASDTSEVAVSANVLRTDFASSQLPDATEFGASVRVANEFSLGRNSAAIGLRSRDTLLGLNDNIGAAAVNETETTTWAVANSTRELSERSSAVVNAVASRVRYTSAAANRNDYDFGSVGFGTDYQIDPRLFGSLRLLMDGYQTEPTPLFLFGIKVGTEQQTAFSVGPSVGLVWEAAERYQVAGDFSARRRWNSKEVSFEIPGRPKFQTSAETDDPEYLGNLAVTRVLDRGTVRVGFNRNLVPSSYGQLRTRDTASIYASRELTAQSSLAIATSIANEEQESSLTPNRRLTLTNTRWINVELSYVRQLSADLSFTASYAFETQKTESVDSVESNTLSVSLRYRMGNTG
jgi:hypothetical protein